MRRGANIKPGAPVGASQPGIAAEASHPAHETEEHRLASNAQAHTGQDLMTLCDDDRRGIWNMTGSSPGAATGAFQLGEALVLLSLALSPIARLWTMRSLVSRKYLHYGRRRVTNATCIAKLV